MSPEPSPTDQSQPRSAKNEGQQAALLDLIRFPDGDEFPDFEPQELRIAPRIPDLD